mmetsp:Transcript_150623/g.280778  ORF Transcript_150623/g.280778 Transcript_150623/m.280778 type:complete len:283 (-) Transcript_150623:107-955(-)
MACCCSLICMILGILILVDSSAAVEKVIRYDAGMTEHIFSLEEDMRNKVFLWYELQGMHVNQKRFIESRDGDIAGGFPTRYSCDSAETIEQVRWRRPGDDDFYALLGNSSFRPCGLIALAMFADEFKLETIDGVEMRLDQSGLALPGEDAIYDRTVASDAHGLLLNGERSWLRIGPPHHLFEHFKVWYRTPAAPFVRNLWAVIPEGLPKGQYRLRFVTNSAVWTGAWAVSEKRVVIGEAHTLGSVGARSFLGQAFLAFGVVEIIVALVFAAVPKNLGSLLQA